jgi:aldehyde:ferredoxin oxidoreductase
MGALDIGGYTGKMARVDLSKGVCLAEDISEEIIEKWIGGTGLGAKYIYDEVPAGVAWSDPENRLVMAAGPFEGSGVSGGGSFSVVGKGPMTNLAGASQANGFFGAYLKFSGFDALILQGASPTLVYLVIKEGRVEIRDAGHLAGKDVWETEALIRDELGVKGKDVSVFGIGPAGENRVRFAAIVGDGGHVVSKNGFGAVMGSKNVKAVAAFRGERSFPIHDEAALREMDNKLFEDAKTFLGGLVHKWGTVGVFSKAAQAGFLPVKNYTTSIFPPHEDMNGEYIRTQFKIESRPCYRCRIAHVKQVTVTEGPFAGFTAEEPEYEELASWGPMIGQSDPGTAIMLSDLNNRLGMDCNEGGWLMGWVMECYEKGALTKEDLDGLDMSWGNVESVSQMLHRIARREGIGDLLAEGVMRASQKVGGEASDWAIYTKKGASPRGHDHRARWYEMFDTCMSNTGTIEATWGGVFPEMLGLPPATDPFSHEEVCEVLAKTNGWRQFDDSLVTCRLCHVDPQLVLGCLNAITGWNMDVAGAMKVGLRVVNLLRVFNFRHGHSIQNEAPSTRYGSVPTDGPAEGRNIMEKWDQMVESYYKTMGWDTKTGKPLPETLEKLGIRQD